eukprot:762521-Hanusia_phi.AAC.10
MSPRQRRFLIRLSTVVSRYVSCGSSRHGAEATAGMGDRSRRKWHGSDGDRDGLLPPVMAGQQSIVLEG